jgi:hypothetical protein
MTETACPKVKQHIGLAADFEGAVNVVINHLMTSTYHRMEQDDANEQIGNMNIEEIDWNDEWGPKETYFAKKKQWETDEAATEPAAASWGRDDWAREKAGWDDQAGPYGKGKGKGSKGKGKKGKGGKGGGDRGGGGGQEVTASIVDLVTGIATAVANQNQQNPPPMQLQLANNNALAVGQGGVATRSNINLIIENISRCYICCSLEASFSC